MPTQQMYSEIAGIIKKNKIEYEEAGYTNKAIDIDFVEDLADYFERREKELNTRAYGKIRGRAFRQFYRQQFLKDCGVE